MSGVGVKRAASKNSPAQALRAEQAEISHNLQGQRLGRKGRGTRERILTAAMRLIQRADDTTISLSAVAREASLGMTTLYLYFSDLTELVLAVLDPVMASAEEKFVAHLRERWSDEDLADHCSTFVHSYHEFWARNAQILHLRNSYADANDERMRNHRIQMSQPIMKLLIKQMDGDPDEPRSRAGGMATVLLTGLERLVTITTDVRFSSLPIEAPHEHIQNLLQAEIRLLEMGIRDLRDAAKTQ